MPFSGDRDPILTGVNGLGTMIGTFFTSNTRPNPLSFIGLCGGEQVPCTQ